MNSYLLGILGYNASLGPSGVFQIQIAIRSSVAHIRNLRIAPSAINAPPPKFVPPSLGVGMPSDDDESSAPRRIYGLQEERIERDAWKTSHFGD
ncbi:Mediator of RNA polymerase II transcription subunit 11 [Mycena sanguinolenta]|uniref:Mediator of RNA polymerase II transcription subunit 11 n=1 Tax=Mycena sanguinolenta TaxID=230812 RepID=A0A8H6XBS3_9AGAR|nr:Mediator of RNA polymerase II transcription subunit 11 [Mycena sanguinolenta]